MLAKHNFWNFIFSVFFVVVLVAALWVMYVMRGGFLVSVPPFDMLLLTLATFRITRLVVYDKIAQWFRDMFAGGADGTFKGTVEDLLACPWCIGMWAALIVVFTYFVFIWAWSVILLLALAGAGTLLQVLANAIGWHAENLKMEAKERQRDLRL